jgi:hypothetical protein
MSKPKIYTMHFATIYPLYITKAERKGRNQAEVDEIIGWLTGYDATGIEARLNDETDLEQFFHQAPRLNPLRQKITGGWSDRKSRRVAEGQRGRTHRFSRVPRDLHGCGRRLDAW